MQLREVACDIGQPILAQRRPGLAIGGMYGGRGAIQQRPAFRRQRQFQAAPILRRGLALHEPARLQAVDQTRHLGARGVDGDAKLRRHGRLSAIGDQQAHDQVLAHVQRVRCQRALDVMSEQSGGAQQEAGGEHQVVRRVRVFRAEPGNALFERHLLHSI
ncbi:hypothetical protein D3C72_1869520 [compost metagenome]